MDEIRSVDEAQANGIRIASIVRQILLGVRDLHDACEVESATDVAIELIMKRKL